MSAKTKAAMLSGRLIPSDVGVMVTEEIAGLSEAVLEGLESNCVCCSLTVAFGNSVGWLGIWMRAVSFFGLGFIATGATSEVARGIFAAAGNMGFANGATGAEGAAGAPTAAGRAMGGGGAAGRPEAEGASGGLGSPAPGGGISGVTGALGAPGATGRIPGAEGKVGATGTLGEAGEPAMGGRGKTGACVGKDGAAVDGVLSADGVDGSPTPGLAGDADGKDGVAEGTDGVAEATDGVAEETDGVAERTDGVAEETDGVAEETDGVAEETDGVAGAEERFAPRGVGGTKGLGAFVGNGVNGVAPGATGTATRGVASGFVPTAGGLLGATPIGRGFTGAAGTALTEGIAAGKTEASLAAEVTGV